MGYTQNNEYYYDGPVEEFGKCIASRWTGTTYAPSEKKALSNLAYQFKQEYDKVPGSRITLPGKLVNLTRKER